MNRKITKKLPVQLTDKEKQEYGETIANLDVQIEALENEKKFTVKKYNLSINELTDERKRLSHIVDSGEEERSIECEVQYNTPEFGKKTIIRIDMDFDNIVEVTNMEQYEIEQSQQLDVFDEAESDLSAESPDALPENEPLNNVEENFEEVTNE